MEDPLAIRYYTLLGRSVIAFFAEENVSFRAVLEADEYWFRDKHYLENVRNRPGNSIF